jgi:hypothetical protein
VSARAALRKQVYAGGERSVKQPVSESKCIKEAGDTFLRNVGSQTAQCYIPEDGNIHNYRCENFKSY